MKKIKFVFAYPVANTSVFSFPFEPYVKTTLRLDA